MREGKHEALPRNVFDQLYKQLFVFLRAKTELKHTPCATGRIQRQYLVES